MVKTWGPFNDLCHGVACLVPTSVLTPHSHNRFTDVAPRKNTQASSVLMLILTTLKSGSHASKVALVLVSVVVFLFQTLETLSNFNNTAGCLKVEADLCIPSHDSS